jgi:hypothetical protein
VGGVQAGSGHVAPDGEERAQQRREKTVAEQEQTALPAAGNGSPRFRCRWEARTAPCST